MDDIKLINFCAVKKTMNRVKRHPMELGKNICKSYI